MGQDEQVPDRVVPSGVLPRWLAMGKVRFVALIWACAFYGYFAIIVLAGQLPKLFR